MKQIEMPLKIINTELSTIKTLAEVEVEQIELALARLDGNLSAASEVLGVSKSTLHRKVANYGLSAKVMQFRGWDEA